MRYVKQHGRFGTQDAAPAQGQMTGTEGSAGDSVLLPSLDPAHNEGSGPPLNKQRCYFRLLSTQTCKGILQAPF